jgi:hypothetical protein
MWLRNILFIAVITGGLALVTASLLKSDPFPTTTVHPKAAIAETVQQVDAAFNAHWQTNNAQPTSTAPTLLIARRLSLGLTGTIPSLEEIRALEVQPEDQRIAWWCAHLLEDPRTSDYLAERFARALVGVENGPFLVYRRRRFVNWLSERLQANTPYDALVRELIAAEGTWTSAPEANFITVTIDQNEKTGPSESKLAGRLTRGFLGVRLDCVECHNDFLHDKWKQQDFHQLAAFFGPASSGLSGVRDEDKPYQYALKRGEDPEEITAAVPFLAELLPDDGTLRERLAGWVTHPGNRPFARSAVNRIWALMLGRPLSSPVDEIPLEAPYPPGMEVLADDFIANGYDLHRLIRIIAECQVFQRDSLSEEGDGHVTSHQETHWAAFGLTRLRPEQVAGSLLQAASLETIDASAHIIRRFARASGQNEFVKRFGDIGEDEFSDQGGSIPQRLVMMNGDLIEERTKDDLVMNAATRLAVVTKDDGIAIESAYLAVLSRRPTIEEKTHFEAKLNGLKDRERKNMLQDLYWALLNSTEFSWGH